MRANDGKLLASHLLLSLWALSGCICWAFWAPAAAHPNPLPLWATICSLATIWVLSVAGSFLGFLWQSLSRLCSWGGPDRCPTAVIWGSLGLLPSIPMWLPRPAWSCWCCWEGSTCSTAVFSSRHCPVCPSVLMATSCLAGWDGVTIKARTSPGIMVLSLAPPSQQHNLLSPFSCVGCWWYFPRLEKACSPSHAEQGTLRWVVCNAPPLWKETKFFQG